MPQRFVSPLRLRWLEYLAEHGETAWIDMPKRPTGKTSSVTWQPMVDAGFITARFHGSAWRFAITDTGRKALAKATQREPA